jgi:hypothetical protein
MKNVGFRRLRFWPRFRKPSLFLLAQNTPFVDKMILSICKSEQMFARTIINKDGDGVKSIASPLVP